MTPLTDDANDWHILRKPSLRNRSDIWTSIWVTFVRHGQILPVLLACLALFDISATKVSNEGIFPQVDLIREINRIHAKYRYGITVHAVYSLKSAQSYQSRRSLKTVIIQESVILQTSVTFLITENCNITSEITEFCNIRKQGIKELHLGFYCSIACIL